VVDEIVTRSQHDAVINDHQTTEMLGFENLNFLEFGLFFVQFLFNTERKRQSGVIGNFGEPVLVIYHKRTPEYVTVIICQARQYQKYYAHRDV